MRIVGVTTFGGPERLQLLEAPEPHAGPGEVRIRVHAATINPTDVGLRQGYQGYQLPEATVQRSNSHQIISVRTRRQGCDG